MARKTIFVSDISGKELDESKAVSIRIQDGSGEWYGIDASQEEIDKLLGSVLKDDHNITAEVQEEQNDRYSRYLKSKIEDGTVIEPSAVRSSARRARADGGTVAPSGSGRTPEQLAKVREWARENNIEVSDRGRVKQEILDKYDEAHKGQ